MRQVKLQRLGLLGQPKIKKVEPKVEMKAEAKMEAKAEIKAEPAKKIK